MLMPKRVKWRKQHRGRMTGKALRGADLNFGEYGLQALEPGWITARQIEAARRTIVRAMKRHGKVWIRMFPDYPTTKKPAETRMGSGKGAPEGWCAPIRAGRILYEVKGVELAVAKVALTRAMHKLSVKTIIVVKEGAE